MSILRRQPSATAAPNAGASGQPPSQEIAASEATPGTGELLSPAEAGAVLGVPAKRLERWRATGDGPRFVRLTRKTIKYRAADIQAFIESRCVSSTAA
jgi:hypothetical protein